MTILSDIVVIWFVASVLIVLVIDENKKYSIMEIILYFPFFCFMALVTAFGAIFAFLFKERF